MYKHITEIINEAEKDISSVWAQRFQHFIVARPQATEEEVINALIPKCVYNVLVKYYEKDGSFEEGVHGLHARLIGGRGNDTVYEIDLAIVTPEDGMYHVMRGVKVCNAQAGDDPTPHFFEAENAERIEAILIEASQDTSFISGPSTVQ